MYEYILLDKIKFLQVSNWATKCLKTEFKHFQLSPYFEFTIIIWWLKMLNGPQISDIFGLL